MFSLLTFHNFYLSGSSPLATTHPYTLEDPRFSQEWRSEVYPLANLAIMIPDDRPLTYRLGPCFGDDPPPLFA